MVVQQEGGAMIAAPGIVARDDMQADVLHVGADGLEFLLNVVQHSVVIDIDMYHLTLRQYFNEEMIRRIDSLNLTGPGVGILGISEPGSLVAGPLSGHIITLFFGSHFFKY